MDLDNNYDYEEVGEVEIPETDIEFSPEDEAAYTYFEERNPGTTRQHYYDRILKTRQPEGTKPAIDEFENEPEVIEDDGLTHEERRLQELQDSYFEEGYDYETAGILAQKDYQIEALEGKQKPVVLSQEDERAYKYYEKHNPGTTRKQYYNKVIKPKEKLSLFR